MCEGCQAKRQSNFWLSTSSVQRVQKHLNHHLCSQEAWSCPNDSTWKGQQLQTKQQKKHPELYLTNKYQKSPVKQESG